MHPHPLPRVDEISDPDKNDSVQSFPHSQAIMAVLLFKESHKALSHLQASHRHSGLAHMNIEEPLTAPLLKVLFTDLL